MKLLLCELQLNCTVFALTSLDAREISQLHILTLVKEYTHINLRTHSLRDLNLRIHSLRDLIPSQGTHTHHHLLAACSPAPLQNCVPPRTRLSQFDCWAAYRRPNNQTERTESAAELNLTCRAIRYKGNAANLNLTCALQFMKNVAKMPHYTLQGKSGKT